RQLSRSEGLPDDVKEGLKSFVSAARQELVTRESQQQQQQQTEQPPAEQPQPEKKQVEEPPPPQPEQQVTQPEAAPAAPAEVDDEALAQANKLLSEQRAVSELSVDELKQRLRQARRLSANEKLPADVRDQLKGIVDASRQELVARESQQQQQQQQTEQPPAEQPQPEKKQVEEPPPPQPEQQATPAPELKVEQPEQQQITQPETAPSAPAAAADDKALAQANKLLSDQRPASELSVNDLRDRIRQARRLSANEKLPSDLRDQLKGIVE